MWFHEAYNDIQDHKDSSILAFNQFKRELENAMVRARSKEDLNKLKITLNNLDEAIYKLKSNLA